MRILRRNTPAVRTFGHLVATTKRFTGFYNGTYYHNGEAIADLPEIIVISSVIGAVTFTFLTSAIYYLLG